MKSTEFLNEGVVDAMEEMLVLIKRDCQPYLQQNKSALVELPLWRGMNTGDEKDTRGPFRKKSVRLSDRIPKDTPQDIHDELNFGLQKKYGHPYRNALFVTGAKGQTYNYGDAFIIFPIGHFEFIWHPDIRDLWDTIATAYSLDPRDSKIPNETMDKITYFMLKADYQTTDLEKAISNRGEIMMWCKSYYAINALMFGGLWERQAFEERLYE